MACFLVSAAEAAVVTAVKKAEEKKETASSGKEEAAAVHVPLSKKLGWLSHMLWGGAFLLLIEHMWHGEIVPYFPFLTAMRSPEDTAEMFHEMATVGVSMAVLITVVWLGMVGVSVLIEKRKNAKSAEE